MARELMELFENVNNVRFVGNEYCDEVRRELPVYELHEIPADEWNRRAKISNTKAFIETCGREPKNYDELMIWVYSHLPFEVVPEKYKSHFEPASKRSDCINLQ